MQWNGMESYSRAIDPSHPNMISSILRIIRSSMQNWDPFNRRVGRFPQYREHSSANTRRSLGTEDYISRTTACRHETLN